MQSWRITVVSLALLLLVLAPQNALGQDQGAVRVFAPVHPNVRAAIQELITARVPGINVKVEGPELLFGVELERISVLELAQRVEAGMYDVVVMSAATNYFITQGLLLDLDPYVARSGFANPLFESMRVNGRLYDLPVLIDQFVVVYNRDLFDGHGLPYPTIGWTWDEFVEAAVRTSNSLGKEPMYGATLSVTSLWPSILYQSSGELLDIDDETFSYSLSVISQLLLGDALILDGYGSSPHFRNGQAAMQVNTLVAALLQHQAFRLGESGLNWGIAPLPTMPGQEGVNQMVEFQTIGIAANTRYPLESWEVARALAENGANLLGNSLDLSAFATLDRVDAWIDQVLPSGMEPVRAELRAILRGRNAYFGRGDIQANQAMARELTTQLRLLLEGGTTQQQTLDALIEKRDGLRRQAQ